jgi:hypothetical protein
MNNKTIKPFVGAEIPKIHSGRKTAGLLGFSYLTNKKYASFFI